MLNLSFVPQPGGAAGQRSADWLLPPLSWFLHFDHLAAGHQGHRAAGVVLHLPLISLQVPVAAHGERHEQYLQVKKKPKSMSEAITVNWKLNFRILQVTLNSSPSVCTVHFWHTRRSTSASLQPRVFLFWWGRWATTNIQLNWRLPFVWLSHNWTSNRLFQVPDIDALLSHMFTDLQQHPEKAEGAGQLLFEMCKGVRHMFHSCAAKVSSFRESNLCSDGI